MNPGGATDCATALLCCCLQTLLSLQVLEEQYQYAYYMHADDDSYVRLDLVLQLLVGAEQAGRSYCGATVTPPNLHMRGHLFMHSAM